MRKQKLVQLRIFMQDLPQNDLPESLSPAVKKTYKNQGVLLYSVNEITTIFDSEVD